PTLSHQPSSYSDSRERFERRKGELSLALAFFCTSRVGRCPDLRQNKRDSERNVLDGDHGLFHSSFNRERSFSMQRRYPLGFRCIPSPSSNSRERFPAASAMSVDRSRKWQFGLEEQICFACRFRFRI